MHLISINLTVQGPNHVNLILLQVFNLSLMGARGLHGLYFSWFVMGVNVIYGLAGIVITCCSYYVLCINNHC